MPGRQQAAEAAVVQRLHHQPDAVGALSATAAQQGGAAATSDYTIAGLNLSMTSPAVSDIYTQVTDALGTVGGLVDTLNTDLADLSLTLPAGVSASSTLAVTTPDLTGLIPATVSANGVTVNLQTGEVTVDLATLLGGINGLDPNTPLLTSATIDKITTNVIDLITDELNNVVSQVVDIIDNLTFSGAVTLTLPAGSGSLAVDVTGPLSAPVVNVDTSGVVGVVDTVLGLLGLSVSGVGTLVTDAVDDLIANVTNGVADLGTTIADITGGLSDTLSPVFTLLSTILTLTANVQPTSAPVNAAGGDLGAGSFTVRALAIGLVPETELASTVNLASATVRGTAAAVDTDADATDADATDTDADAPTDTEADADGTDATAADTAADTAGSTDGTLASTGVDAAWIGGLGGLALLMLAAGAGVLVARRKASQH